MKDKSNSNKTATKGDIKSLKAEFKRTEKVLWNEILKVGEKVENLEEKVGSLDGKFDRAFTKLDGIAKGIDDLRTDNAMGADQIYELRKQAKKHDERITKLESAQSA